MCGIVADFADSVKFGKKTGIEQVSILEQDQPVEMRLRGIVLKSEMVKQFDDHCLGKAAQTDGHEIRLTRPGLFGLTRQFMETRPELLKETEIIGVFVGHLAAPRTETLA